MKKVIATAAGLLMVGAMATAASADVSLSGDARARYRVHIDNDFGASNGDKDITKFDSRVRVKVTAKAKGGAYAKGRIRLMDETWDGVAGKAYNSGIIGDKNIWVDYAYIGVPMGALTVDAGFMPASFSKWFSDDGRKDRLKFTYKHKSGKLIYFYDKNQEFSDNPVSEANDDDMDGHGIVFLQKFGDWTTKGIAIYLDDSVDRKTVTDAAGVESVVDRKDASGLVGSLNLKGKVAGMGLEGEISYKNADVQGTADDGIGGFLAFSPKFGSVSPTFLLGFTQDGFSADESFGALMIGGDEPITVISRIGTGGDTIFAGVKSNFKLSESMKLGANLLYADVDAYGTFLEISGQATYAISEGADFTVKAGYLSPSLDAPGAVEDAAIGAYARLLVKF